MAVQLVTLPNGQQVYVNERGEMCDVYGRPACMQNNIAPAPGYMNAYNQPNNGYYGGMQNSMPAPNMAMPVGNNVMNITGSSSPVQQDPYGTSTSTYSSRRRPTNEPAQPQIKVPVPEEDKPKKEIPVEVPTLTKYILGPDVKAMKTNDTIDFMGSGHTLDTMPISKPVNKSNTGTELYMNVLKNIGTTPNPNTIYTMEWQSTATSKIIYDKVERDHILSKVSNYHNLDLDRCLPNIVHTINLLSKDINSITSDRGLFIDDARDLQELELSIKGNMTGMPARALDYYTKAFKDTLDMFSNLVEKEPVDLISTKGVIEVKPEITRKVVVFNNKVLESAIKLYKQMDKSNYSFKLVKYSFIELYHIVRAEIDRSKELYSDFVIMGDNGKCDPTFITMRVINPLKYMEYTDMSSEDEIRSRTSTLLLTFVSNAQLK